MKLSDVGLIIALCGAAFAPPRNACADEVVQGELQPVASEGLRATVPVKISLSPNRPARVTREPSYLNTPLYGTITLGDAKDSTIVVALDASPTTTRPRLYIDANGNGDLTDDPPVALTSVDLPAPQPAPPAAKPGSSPRVAGASAPAKSPSRMVRGYTAAVPVIARYDLTGRAATTASRLVFTLQNGDLTCNRDYGRVGTLRLNGRAYRIALVDQAVDGRFDLFRHGDTEPARVTLYIDRNEDGIFDPNTEAYDAGKPFRFSGGSYQVTTIDPRGTRIALKRTGGKVRGTVTAAELRVGGEVIDFDAVTTGDKPVQFPDDYKGKVVLLDFWATWCGPCVEEVPHVVQTYRQYHPQGFEILGISLDRKGQKNTLLRFIAEHGMTWPQVYDGGYWKAEIAVLYGINAIPDMILVDGDTGRIVARGEQLRQGALETWVAKALENRKH